MPPSCCFHSVQPVGSGIPCFVARPATFHSDPFQSVLFLFLYLLYLPSFLTGPFEDQSLQIPAEPHCVVQIPICFSIPHIPPEPFPVNGPLLHICSANLLSDSLFHPTAEDWFVCAFSRPATVCSTVHSETAVPEGYHSIIFLSEWNHANAAPDVPHPPRSIYLTNGQTCSYEYFFHYIL